MPQKTLHDRRQIAMSQARRRAIRWGQIAKALRARGDLQGASHAEARELESMTVLKGLVREREAT